jgi:hypothetical protein
MAPIAGPMAAAAPTQRSTRRRTRHRTQHRVRSGAVSVRDHRPVDLESTGTRTAVPVRSAGCRPRMALRTVEMEIERVAA